MRPAETTDSILTTMRVVPEGGGVLGPSLLIIRDGVAEQRELAGQKEWVIGRLPKCDICVAHQTLSKEHAVLRGPPWTIEDLGSLNGTKVGGEALKPGQARALRGGARIELGSVQAVLQADDEGEGPPSARQEKGQLSQEKLVARVAASELSVLLLGETGVGKEVCAGEIHRRSPRASGPFVAINCAALPEALAESELFGHARGAFTGALQAKKGLIEAASGGTVLLDEVGELTLGLQAKLLRVLQDRAVLRVGETEPRQVDVRFVAATNRELLAEVEAARFRRDLYYRLNGITLRLPPLRERLGELPALARRFAEDEAARQGRPAPGLSPEALRALGAHRWPGNIRELKNTIERAVVLCDGPELLREHIQLDEAATEAATEVAAEGLRQGRAVAERAMILEALTRAGGNQTEAAKLLGLSRRMLLYKLDALGIERPRKGR